MKYSSAIVIIFLTSLIIRGAFADGSQERRMTYLESHEIQIQTLSSKVFTIECIEGEILFGEFVVISDGDLYPGDQRKYDLWVGWGNGIDFYIFNQANYNSWTIGKEVTSSFEKINAVSLSWSININESGLWNIVYINDSPSYMKTVKGSIYHSNSTNYILIGLLFGVIGIVVTILIIWKLKTKISS